MQTPCPWVTGPGHTQAGSSVSHCDFGVVQKCMCNKWADVRIAELLSLLLLPFAGYKAHLYTQLLIKTQDILIQHEYPCENKERDKEGRT